MAKELIPLPDQADLKKAGRIFRPRDREKDNHEYIRKSTAAEMHAADVLYVSIPKVTGLGILADALFGKLSGLPPNFRITLKGIKALYRGTDASDGQIRKAIHELEEKKILTCATAIEEGTSKLSGRQYIFYGKLTDPGMSKLLNTAGKKRKKPTPCKTRARKGGSLYKEGYNNPSSNSAPKGAEDNSFFSTDDPGLELEAETEAPQAPTNTDLVTPVPGEEGSVIIKSGEDVVTFIHRLSPVEQALNKFSILEEVENHEYRPKDLCIIPHEDARADESYDGFSFFWEAPMMFAPYPAGTTAREAYPTRDNWFPAYLFMAIISKLNKCETSWTPKTFRVFFDKFHEGMIPEVQLRETWEYSPHNSEGKLEKIWADFSDPIALAKGWRAFYSRFTTAFSNQFEGLPTEMLKDANARLINLSYRGDYTSLRWEQPDHPWLKMKPGEVVSKLSSTNPVGELIQFHDFCSKFCEKFQATGILETCYTPILKAFQENPDVMERAKHWMARLGQEQWESAMRTGLFTLEEGKKIQEERYLSAITAIAYIRHNPHYKRGMLKPCANLCLLPVTARSEWP